MNTQDVKLNCSQCGKKVGVVTIMGGTMNVMSTPMCCMDCLPKRLEKLEEENYNPTILESIRSWMLK